MRGSNCETWSQVCDDLGSNIQYSAGRILTLNGRITASYYVDNLGSQVLFPNNDAVFQDDSTPTHTARSVYSWFEEHEDGLQHLWLAQLPNLNIIESLWSVLERRVRSRFPSSSREEWYSIPLETIQNLHKSIPRRIQDVLQSMVDQLHINKEICILHSCFHYFCPSPVYSAKLYSMG